MAALKGLSVVQLGGGIAAPVLGMLLADQGATVVQVVGPCDAEVAGPGPEIWARAARRVALDLRDEPDRQGLSALLASADVVVDGWPAGRLGRFGVTVGRPVGQVWCALPAFPDDHPWARVPAWEGVIGAAVGLYDPPIGSAPGFTAIPIASMLGAMLAANTVIAALLARQRDGRGQRVEVPLVGGALLASELKALLTLGAPTAWVTLQWAASPFIAPYRTSDGWLYVHVGQPAHLQTLLRVLASDGHDEAERLTHRLSQATCHDPARTGSVAEADAARRALTAVFRRRDGAYWEALLDDVSVSVVRPCTTWTRHPQPRETGEVVCRTDPTWGELPQPGVQVRLVGAPGSVGTRDPSLHSAARIAAGFRRRRTWQVDVTETSIDTAALHGRVIYDLTQVIAGPVATRTLAQLGATVIRIENPRLTAGWRDAFHIAFNGGKQSVSLDLSSPEGMDALWALMTDRAPEVVVHNFRRGVAERLGLDAVRQRFPSAVVTHLSAFGTTGPWGHRPGWEQNAQAVTGMMVSGSPQAPDVVPVPVNDVGTGLMGSFGTLLALLHRERTGVATDVQTWLTATATLVQSMTQFDPAPTRWTQANGPDATGYSALHRWYRASDGWMMLAASREESVRAIRGIETGPLQDALRSETVAEWQQRAQDAGVGRVVAIVPQTSLDTASQQAWMRDAMHRAAHIGLGEVAEIRPLWTWSRTQPMDVAPARPRGADTERILSSVGHSHAGVPLDTPSGTYDLGRRVVQRIRWVRGQTTWAGFLLWSRVRRALG